MNISTIKIQVITLLFFSFLVVKNTYASVSSEVLTTDHYTIYYNLNNSSCAFALAGKLEDFNNNICDFLESDTLDKINIYIYDDTDKKNLPEIYDRKRDDLFVNTGRNFNLVESELYNTIFKIYLSKIKNYGKWSSAFDQSFIDAIILYPGREHQFIELIRKDIHFNMNASSINLKDIDRFSNDERRSIYTVLIDFIITNYSKKIFIQTLKDTDYYDGFFEALSEITGDSVPEIIEKFNIFLHAQNDDQAGGELDSKQLFMDSDDYTDVSFSLSDDGTVALLQKNGSSFKLVLNDGKTFKLKHSENGSIFSDIVFTGNDQIIITEIVETGSIIHTFDIMREKYLADFTFPFLYISDIKYSGEGDLIFAGRSGMASDIYSFNTNSREMTMLTESGNNFFPVKLNNRIYFISINKKNNITELNPHTGEIKALFSIDGGISHLNRDTDKSLIFSSETNGMNNIYTFELESGMLRQILKDSTSCNFPQIYGKRVYFFSYYKNSYRLFFNTAE